MSDSADFPARGLRGFIAWQKAVDFADRVNLVCDKVERRRGAGLLGQLRRSSASVPSNIAEGYGREPAEFVHYLRVAKGSLQEAATQLELLKRRGVVVTESILDLLRDADEIGAILYTLIRNRGGSP